MWHKEQFALANLRRHDIKKNNDLSALVDNNIVYLKERTLNEPIVCIKNNVVWGCWGFRCYLPFVFAIKISLIG